MYSNLLTYTLPNILAQRFVGWRQLLLTHALPNHGCPRLPHLGAVRDDVRGAVGVLSQHGRHGADDPAARGQCGLLLGRAGHHGGVVVGGPPVVPLARGVRTAVCGVQRGQRPRLPDGRAGQRVGGALLLSALFAGSTTMTEAVTRSKYPAYAAYQRTTSVLIPWLPGTPLDSHEGRVLVDAAMAAVEGGKAAPVGIEETVGVKRSSRSSGGSPGPRARRAPSVGRFSK